MSQEKELGTLSEYDRDEVEELIKKIEKEGWSVEKYFMGKEALGQTKVEINIVK